MKFLAFLLLLPNLLFAFTVRNHCPHPITVALAEGAGVDWNEMPTVSWGWRVVPANGSNSDFPDFYSGQAYRWRSVLVKYNNRTLTNSSNGLCVNPTNGFKINGASTKPCRTGVDHKGFVPTTNLAVHEFNQCADTRAQLNVCNETNEGHLFFALLAYEDSTWTSHGWWRLDNNVNSANHCKKFNFGPGKAGNAVYLYGDVDGGRRYWPAQGEGWFCVDRRNSFNLRNAEKENTCSDLQTYKRVSGDKVQLIEGMKNYSFR